MLRVGYPEETPAELVALLPDGIEKVPIPPEPAGPLEVDFWITGPSPSRAVKTWPRLRGVEVVQAAMAGVDWLLDLVAGRVGEQAGGQVTVCDARGAHTVATAEWAVMAVLASLKYIPLYHGLQLTADWRGRSQASQAYAELERDPAPHQPPVMLEDLSGRRVLIVGYGDIGRAIERRLLAFDVTLVRMARHARPQQEVLAVGELDRQLPGADVVLLALPQTPETAGLMSAARLAAMKQGALLVNLARGPVVDTAALVEELNRRHIRAALDVTDPEPLPPDHPLWKCPNLLLTPHVAAASPGFLERAMRLAAEQVGRVLAGQPLANVVHDGY